ncbi:MAG TPA: DUF433 domain-containing protein [Candidatus Sulfomarinibacteraceae bacterium]|nr:DUF433 domain-containing protein [Candidatus Sulfomarinibacteraceae bacterium]
MAHVERKSPLEANGNGELCVMGTSVSLTSVLHALSKGYTAQEIVQQYPELEPADVHAVLVHYLSHGSQAGL